MNPSIVITSYRQTYGALRVSAIESLLPCGVRGCRGLRQSYPAWFYFRTQFQGYPSDVNPMAEELRIVNRRRKENSTIRMLSETPSDCKLARKVCGQAH